MRKALVLASAFLLALTACGSDNPKDSLVGAIRGLDDYDAVTVTFSVSSDVASLQAAGQEDPIPADVAQKILDSSLTISTRGESPEDGEAQFLLTIAGAEALDVRTFPDSAFVRVDVDAISEAFGGDPKELQSAARQAQDMGLTFVQPALDGEWLEIQGFQQLMEQFSQLSGASNQAQQQAAFEQFAEALEGQATVTPGDEEGPGTHLVVSLGLRETYQKFADIVGGATGGLPPGAMAPLSEVPDENISIDTWVDGNRLTQVEFDFLQVADIAGEEVPEGIQRLAFRLTFEEFSGSIERPTGAVPIDLQEIMGFFMGGVSESMSGSFSGSATYPAPSSTEFPCEFLKGEPREVLLQFKEECPELLKN